MTSKVIDTAHGRILCIADIRGRLSALNDLARENNAKAIIHTGDFGFFEATSLPKINDRTLRHLAMYSPLIPSAQRTHLLDNTPQIIRQTLNIELLSEFPLLLTGQIKLQVPVYTVWGACEDVQVIEKFRSGAYAIDNLHIIDEATSHLLDLGGVKLRLLGLGGAFVPHKLFDNGDGAATIAGAQGTMWTTALQIGELVDTAQRVFDTQDTRLLVTHASPGREGLIAQLALVLKADLTLSAGLHFRYATSYNDFSVQGDFQGYRHRLLLGKESFDRVWDTVKTQVDAVIDDNQRILLEKALSVVERVPPAPSASAPAPDEPAWKNCWNWNLCDAAYGSLVLDIKEGRISAELKSQGFNYAYRRAPTTATPPVSASKPVTPAPPAQPPKASAIDSRPLPPHLAANTTNPADASSDDKRRKKSGASTPDVDGEPGASAPAVATSTGARTPKGGKPPRNPWTIFMRIPATAGAVNEADIRAFFADSATGITRVTLPHAYGNRAKIAYVEFGDEEAMRAGLSGHAEKLKDAIPEVKQALDREAREAAFAQRATSPRDGSTSGVNSPNLSANLSAANLNASTNSNLNTSTNSNLNASTNSNNAGPSSSNTGTPNVNVPPSGSNPAFARGGAFGGGRGRGRGGGGGGFAARGLSAAGLTRGGGPGGRGGHHGNASAANGAGAKEGGGGGEAKASE